MPYIGNQPAQIGAYAVESFNGGGSSFTLSKSATTETVLLFIDGVRQTPTDAYSVSGTTLTTTATTPSGTNNVTVQFLGDVVDFGEPSDNSVTSTKIVDGTIINADINASAAIAQSKLANVPYYTSSGTAPLSPAAGDYWYDSSTNIAKIYNGTDWKNLYLPPLTVDYLVIAGGGSGGKFRAGGGGAGGYRNSYNSETSGGGGASESTLSRIANVAYTVTVGAGGAGRSGTLGGGNAGSDSVFDTITSAGGGRGGSDAGGTQVGGNGGSGGGAGEDSGGPYSGGTGTSNQGYAGGSSGGNAYTSYPGGGGGGAGAVGANTPGNATGGDGGNGLSSSITGSSVTRAGGGGGVGNAGTGGAGGSGGGGAGAVATTNNGTANTGSGGGAWGDNNPGTSGAGGSGVVILRYSAVFNLTVGAGLTYSTSIDGSDKVTTFTAGTGTVSWG